MSTLALLYDIRSDPNPIRASAHGANPNVVSLDVVVSPKMSRVVVSKIQIAMPVGSDDPESITTARELKDPVYDRSGEWVISVSGGTVSITPVSGSPTTVTTAIEFTLPDIAVNEQPGNVPVTATEYPAAPSPKRGPEGILVLTKYRADLPVSAFYADPEVIDDLDAPIKLYWKCSEDGERYLYALPGIGDGYDCAAGVAGVPATIGSVTPPPFELQVYTQNSEGGRTIVDRVYAPVSVTVAQFAPGGDQESLSPDRLRRLTWKAWNTMRCTVKLGNTVLDEDAPADTMHSGYYVFVRDAAPEQHVTVTAHAQRGSSTDTKHFPLTISSAVRVVSAGGGQPTAMALTADGRCAVVQIPVGGIRESDVRVVELDSGRVSTPLASVRLITTLTIANAPAKPVALVVSDFVPPLQFIDLSSFPFKADVYKGSLVAPQCIAASDDGSVAIVGGGLSPYLIRVPERTVTKLNYTHPDQTTAAITPKGDVAVMVSRSFASVDLAQLPGGSPIAQISLRGLVSRSDTGLKLRSTRDGTLALLSIPSAHKIAVLNLAKRALEPAIDLPGSPVDLTVSPAGDYALVAFDSADSIAVLDLRDRTLRPSVIPIGAPATAVALSRDGSRAVVVRADGNLMVIG